MVVWVGQLVSLLGSSMTLFALTIWIWQSTGKATNLALMIVASFGPAVLLAPIAGVVVDRWKRKTVLILSDLCCALAIVAIYALWSAGQLQPWQLYLASAFAGGSQAFQVPALSAAITMMVPKDQLARANGLLSLAQTSSSVAAPLLAGLLLALIGVRGILILDIISFIFGVATLMIARIPEPARTQGRNESSSLWSGALFGLRFISERPSLLGLLSTLFTANIFRTMCLVVLPVMILARTGNDNVALGVVQAAVGMGGVAGGLILTTWGGPRRLVLGMLVGILGSGLFGRFFMGLSQSLPMWAIFGFLGGLFSPFVNACNQAIWQAKVSPETQGRVFAARMFVAQISVPVALLAAGPIVDLWLEPAMAEGGGLSAMGGSILPLGPGAGVALLFVVAGMFEVVVVVFGFLWKPVRMAEELLPDHQVLEAAGEDSQ